MQNVTTPRSFSACGVRFRFALSSRSALSIVMQFPPSLLSPLYFLSLRFASNFPEVLSLSDETQPHLTTIREVLLLSFDVATSVATIRLKYAPVRKNDQCRVQRFFDQAFRTKICHRLRKMWFWYSLRQFFQTPLISTARILQFVWL